MTHYADNWFLLVDSYWGLFVSKYYYNLFYMGSLELLIFEAAKEWIDSDETEIDKHSSKAFAQQGILHNKRNKHKCILFP